VPGIGQAPQVRATRLQVEFNADSQRRADLPHGPDAHVTRSTILDGRDRLLGYSGNGRDFDLSQPSAATFGPDARSDSEVIHDRMMRGRSQRPIYGRSTADLRPINCRSTRGALLRPGPC
jgi:hypothetical protein